MELLYSSSYSESLLHIARKRTGGKIALEGFFFQLQFTLLKLLEELEEGSGNVIVPEGIEDVDFIKTEQNGITNRIFTQVKHSINKSHSSDFWKKGILQNFLEVYFKDRNAEFELVYDMDLSGKNLTSLETGDLNAAVIKHWKGRIDKYLVANDKFAPGIQVDVFDFLQKIKYKKISEKEIQAETIKLLVTKFDITTGNEELYHKTLLNKVLIWAIGRKELKYSDLLREVGIVKTELEKGTVNDAVENGWIQKIEFSQSTEVSAEKYFQGIGGRPAHIAHEIPVRREKREKEIIDVINEIDVTVVKASSGQGKSTLCWQVASLLKKEGYTIYEIKWCGNSENLGSFTTYLRTRQEYLGETPLVIIDGLSFDTAAWHEVAANVSDLPVKFLISSREEDWFKYGGGLSKIVIKTIDLEMSFQEAKAIYQSLERHQQIHQNTPPWQSAWENVSERKLLIEYVYYLTQGTMLDVRIADQIKLLRDNQKVPNGGIKLEILRLIALADICGVKIKTKAITDFIKSEVGYSVDRVSVLESLEKEYFLKIERAHIGGLHRVRSEHLSEILHQTINYIESFSQLLSLVTHKEYKAIFREAFSLLDREEMNSFFGFYAVLPEVNHLTATSEVCEGLFLGIAEENWQQNKEHYDEINQRGGIGICTIDTAPWQGRNFTKEFSKNFKSITDNFEKMDEVISRISRMDVNDNVIDDFLKTIKPNLQIKDIEDVGQLSQWFFRLSIHVSLPETIKPELLLKEGKRLTITTISNACNVFIKSDKNSYQNFLSENKAEIFSLVKMKILAFTLREEEENTLAAEYIITDESNANDESVEKIRHLKLIFPDYSFYRTDGKVAPLSILKTLSHTIESGAYKRMPTENVYDPFQGDLNGKWVSHIERKYFPKTNYEWQEVRISMRKIGLDYIKNIVRLIEMRLSGKLKRETEIIDNITDTGNQFIKFQLGKNTKWGKELKSFEPALKSADKKMQKWGTGLFNYINQNVAIFSLEERDSERIAKFNLISSVRGLKEMQDAFREVVEESYLYFPELDTLEAEENRWYPRWHNSVNFFVENKRKNRLFYGKLSQVISGKYDREERKIWEIIDDALFDFEIVTSFEITRPDYIIHEDILDTLVIGVHDVSLNTERDITGVLSGIAVFAELDFHFVTLIFIQNGNAINATRFSKEKIREIKQFKEGRVFNEGQQIVFLPIEITPALVAPLKGVKMQEIEIQVVYDKQNELLKVLWEYSLYKRKLQNGDNTERYWLLQLKNQYESKTSHLLNDIESKDLQILTTEILEGNKFLSDAEFTERTDKLVDSFRDELSNQ